MSKYITDPARIEEESFKQIRELCDLSKFSRKEQQVVMRIVHTCGLPEIVENTRISENAIDVGLQAIKNRESVICDVEMVKCSLTLRMMQQEPMCFLNKASVISQAKAHNKTRSMIAVDAWKSYIKDSIILIGNAPTALFRLLEILAEGSKKPALVIGVPVGFIGAAESKAQLWKEYEELGIECITIEGNLGGSAIAASVMNALLRIEQDIYL